MNASWEHRINLGLPNVFFTALSPTFNSVFFNSFSNGSATEQIFMVVFFKTLIFYL